MFQPNDMVPVDNIGGDDTNENTNHNNIDAGFIVGGEEFDHANTSENQEEGLGQDQDPPPNTVDENQEEGSGHDEDSPPRKKRYHRHSPHQIQEMEAFFRECPHPDDKQRKQLGRQLGLNHLQIKFWFQNKRTQNKNQHERLENTTLRTENQKLRADNQRYRDAIGQAMCPNCGGPTAIGELSVEEHQIRIENSRLGEEIKHLNAIMERCMDKQIMNYASVSDPIAPPTFEQGMGPVGGNNVYGNGGNLSGPILNGPTQLDKGMVINLAFNAMEELMRMAQVGEPLWIGGINGTSLALNLDEYTRTFRTLGPKLRGFITEASRETAVVPMSHMSIVEMLMNENLWATMFAGMITRAMTHDVLFAGALGNFDGALQIMSAEFQVLSPLVSTRESYFVRYCKQQAEGLWAVVDVSMEHFFPDYPHKSRRRPSGCLIQQIPNNTYSQVTWVEHVDVDDKSVIPNMYKPLICSGQAFGASRWVATMDRQCERIFSIVATEYPPVEPNAALTNEGKKGVLKLAERMVRSFFSGVNNTMATLYSGSAGDDIRVSTIQSIDDPGRPRGVVLSVATSFWVPVPPKPVYNFLRDERNRMQWDFFSTGGPVEKMAEIANGKESSVALYRSVNTTQMIVQENSTDPTASFLIYAPVDVRATERVMNGTGDPDYVPILPLGIAILPDGTIAPGVDGGGSLLTISFQMLAERTPTARLRVSAVATVENLIRLTAKKIRDLFSYGQTA